VDERLRKAILTNKPIPYIYLQIEKLLELEGMSQYKRVCMNRIYERVSEWDIEDCTIDICNGFTICMGEDCIKQCEDILQGYLNKDTVKQLIAYFESENKIIDCLNNEFKTLKIIDTKTLKQGIDNPPYILDSESLMNDYVELLQLELSVRKPLCKAYLKVKNKVIDILSHIRNRAKIKAFMRIVSKYE
jgi:hypothetical protein